MRRGTWTALGTGGAALIAVVAACTGDDPAFIIDLGADSGAQQTDSSTTDASTGEGGSPEADGGVDGSPDSGACGPRDSTPCGCGAAKSCCALDDGGALCQPRGNEDSTLGCTTANIITCVGSCGGGQACCFHGDVTAGEACPKRLTVFDSQCVHFDAGDPENACTDTSSGVRHHVLCRVDADCTPHDAGTCHSAKMDVVDRIIGICAK